MPLFAAIDEGKAAWLRLKERNRKVWPDWISVGHALVAGRSEVMQAAETNSPYGIRYTRKMSEWLEQNGFNTINPQVRYRATTCIENLPAIEQWMATLDPKKRSKLNH